ECEDPTSASQRALRRQVSEVGAVCGNSARTDLCGGRRVTDVPTATQSEIFESPVTEKGLLRFAAQKPEGRWNPGFQRIRYYGFVANCHRARKLELSGLTNDMRVLQEELAQHDDHRVRVAIDVFCCRARKYISAYLAAMGGTDALVFTRGIGENSPAI